MLTEDVEEAVKDVRYLLERGFPRSSAVDFVSDHYELELEKRHLLTRCVFSESEAKKHQEKLIEGSEIEGRKLGVDGYNVLITVESILKGEKIIKCDDGVVRDLQAIFGKYKMSDWTEKALDKILRTVKKLGPEKVNLFFDKQVSKSGELAGLVRRKINNLDLRGNAQAIGGVDKKVWESEVSASSDRIIIERSQRTFDIPAEFLKTENANFVDLTKI